MSTNALDRVARQIREGQIASDELNAFLSKRADAGHHVVRLAERIATAFALAEASLLAARPAHSGHIELDSSEIHIDGATKVEGSLFLDLSGVRHG